MTGHKRTRLALIAAAAITGIAGVSIANATNRSAHSARLVLAPQNIGAISAAGTHLDGIPASLIAGPDYAPTAGSVHTLGAGAAFGWLHDGDVCWSTGPRDNGSSGCASSNTRGVEVVIRDGDLPGSGQPAHVFGLTANGIATVTVTVVSGVTYSTHATGNWFDVQLPADVNPWDVQTVAAATKSGVATTQTFALTPPSTITWRTSGN